MTSRARLKLFLDEGVTASAGRVLEEAGHTVIYLKDAIPTGSSDPLVCAASEANDAILVAHDGDMRKLAQRRGVGQRRFRSLSLIKLSCRESRAPARLLDAMSLIEHEWKVSDGKQDRRIFLVIGDDAMRTHR